MYEDNNGGFKKEDDGDYIFNIVTTNGKPKTIGWSVASVVSAVLSIMFSSTGWAGLIFGIIAVFFSIYSRKYLGYFNGPSIAGLVIGIFGIVFSAYVLVLIYVYDTTFFDFLEFGLPSEIPEGDNSGNV